MKSNNNMMMPRIAGWVTLAGGWALLFAGSAEMALTCFVGSIILFTTIRLSD